MCWSPWVRQQAIKINQEHKLLKNFEASHSFINSFKKANRISSRRVTKFVSKKSFADCDKIDAAGKSFVDDIQKFIRKHRIPLSAVFNSDQSGFVKEMRGMRTLALVGQKKVFRVVDSVAATTHSFTVMPLISASGELQEKLYIVLPEKDGKFPSTPIFKTRDLVVLASKSHIMNYSLLFDWVKECVLSKDMPKKMLLLVDSWSPFKNHVEIQKLVPRDRTLFIKNIPPGTTGKVQPLDVYFFWDVQKICQEGDLICPSASDQLSRASPR